MRGAVTRTTLPTLICGALGLSCSPPAPQNQTAREPAALATWVEAQDAADEAAETAGPARLLFRAEFEGAVEIHAPTDCWDRGCWQDVSSADGAAAFAWPPSIWGGGGGRFQLITDIPRTTAARVGDFMLNRIETVTGHDGGPTKALYQEISRNVNGTDPMGTSVAQNAFQLLPEREASDLYVSFWIKLQPDLERRMNRLPPGPGVRNGGTWRGFFAFKTGRQAKWGGPANDGDYRVEVYVMTYGGGTPYWVALGDNEAGGDAPGVNHWSVENRSVAVPIGRWFKFEIFWHRSGDGDGRVWAAVDGRTIFDRYGPNVGAWELPINRIMAPLLYSGSSMPIYQWIDDLEIWDGFPPHRDVAP